MKRAYWASCALIAAALVFGGEAHACMPMPPPPAEQGESEASHAARVAAWQAQRDAEDAAWRLSQQTRIWDQSQQVFVARVERTRMVERDGIGETPLVTLRPLRWLKGNGRARTFTLGYREMTSCGPIPAFDAVAGAVGESFVVYVDGNRPRQSTVLHALRPDRITESRARAALDAEE